MDCEDEGEDDIFAINQLEAMRLLEEAWNGVKQLTIANCWRHTGILPSDDEEPSSSRAQASDPDVEFEVQEATNALQRLNLTVSNRKGIRHLLPKPRLVDDIEELLAEPNAPEWVEEDTSELELLKMVCQTSIIQHCILIIPIQLREKDENEDGPMSVSLQEPSLMASLSAVDTLYTLALFNAHETEFSNLLHTLSNVRSCLKARQCSALSNSKITTYFQNTETKEKEISDGETDNREVIEVD